MQGRDGDECRDGLEMSAGTGKEGAKGRVKAGEIGQGGGNNKNIEKSLELSKGMTTFAIPKRRTR